ncbi:MAG: hypothetical protein M4579_002064 [Chaenotheca gracillima]|nr:MAG: hypothetical protein M4579_002064 [Chaenotheca gracillima]
MPQIANLRNASTFPTVLALPVEGTGDLNYFLNVRGVFFPSRYWSILAEITKVSLGDQPRMTVKDLEGEEFTTPIHGDLTTLDRAACREGHTILIMNPERRHAEDSTWEVPVKSVEIMTDLLPKIIPMALNVLYELNDRVQTQCAQNPAKEKACHACGKLGKEYQRCQRCELVYYCSKECQVKGWTEHGHREDCKILRDINGIFTTNWAR